MLRKLSPLFLLLFLYSCEDKVEGCSEAFMSDYNSMKSSFSKVSKSTATLSDRSAFQESLDKFLKSHKDVECKSGKDELKPTDEVAQMVKDLESKTVFTPEVVYGDDNRVDVEDSTNENFRKWSRATAAQINATDIDENNNLPDETLAQSFRLCKDQRFREQINPARCSGFLVAPDVLVTAGHCMETNFDCETKRWVFDFVKGVKTLNSENVYKCVEILSQKLDGRTQEDYAVVRLDRAVSGRDHLSFRTKGDVAKDQKLVVIGHPSGLPTKIADGAKVRSTNDKAFFVANLDTFGGNSGSAVLDAETGLVEGILVRGENDYKYIEDGAGGYCQIVNVCKEDECRGEDVMRMTVVKGLPTQVTLDPKEVKKSLFETESDEKESKTSFLPLYFVTHKEKMVSGRKFLDTCTLHVTDVAKATEWSDSFTGSCDDAKVTEILENFTGN